MSTVPTTNDGGSVRLTMRHYMGTGPTTNDGGCALELCLYYDLQTRKKKSLINRNSIIKILELAVDIGGGLSALFLRIF